MTTTPEIRLKRFIHFGAESPTYLPADRYKSRFEQDTVTAVEALVADEKLKDITNIILKAFTDGYSIYPEALVFALAIAARQTISQELRELAYVTARSVCKEPGDLFLFVKFCNELAPGKGIGNGIKKVVKEWYISQDPMALLISITQHFSWHGWSHKDLIKLCHFSAKDNDALASIVHYVCRGFSDMKKDFADKPEARQLIIYLQALDDFRTEEDRGEAARMIETNKFTLGQVSSKAIRLKWTWSIFVPKLSLRDLLENIKRLGYMRFINEDQPIASLVIEALANQESIAKSNIHPAEVLVVLRQYEKIIEKDPLVVKSPPNHTNPEKQLPLAINPKIVEALNNLMVSTFKLLVPTGLRYMVIIDVRKEMVHGQCYQNNRISPLMAASVISLGLAKTERSVMIGTYGNGGTVHTVRIGKNLSIQETHDKYAAIESCPVDLSQPINWAKNKAKEFDVFVMITDNQVQQANMMSPARAIQQYRKKMKRPTTKLIICGLSCVAPFNIADDTDPGILEIAGFDGKVPRVIEAFSRGAF